MSSIRLVPIVLALAAGPLSIATAQAVLRADSTLTAADETLTLLPGSNAIEGQRFIADLRGPSAATVLITIAGEEACAALGRRQDPQALPSKFETVRVALDADGHGALFLQGWKAGSELVLRASVASVTGRVSGMTQSLSVRPLPAQPVGASSSAASAPPITGPWAPVRRGVTTPPPPGAQVSPAQAGVGATISISGAALAPLAGYAAKDVRVVAPAITGSIAKTNTVGSNSITATITVGSPFAESAPLLMKGGTGTYSAVPPFNGMSYGQPAWGWKALAGGPVVSSDTMFKTDPQSVFQPCGDPAMFVELHYRIENGLLKVKLPGTKACTGDKFNFELGFGLQDGTSIAVSCKTTQGLVNAYGWSADVNAPLWPLTWALAVPPSGCTPTFDAASNEIWITGPSGNPITTFDAVSYLRIDFDPAQHVIVTEMHGVDDDYATGNGVEATTPGAAIENYVLTHYSIPTRREYDMSTCDKWLRDTFSGYGPGPYGRVRSGNVQVHMNGFGCQTDTDSIVIGFTATPVPAFDWGAGLPKLKALNYAWNPGDDATLCFDLSQMPVVSATYQLADTRNILERVNANQLDIGVQDDTTVDYITVKVLRSITP